MPISEDDLMHRPKTYCFACGGNFRTLGMKSHYVPHEPDCPRASRIRKVSDDVDEDQKYAPVMPPVRWPEGPSAVSDMVRERPQRKKKW